MRGLVLGFIVFVNFILQTTLFHYIEIMGVQPNTALLLIVSYAILRGDLEGAVFGFFHGILIDIFYAPYIGLNAFLYMMLGYLCGKPFRDFYRENYIFPLILSFLGMLGYEFISYVVNYMLQGRVQFGLYLQKIIVPETVYTLLFCVPVYVLVAKINRGMEKRKKKSKSLF